MELPYRTYTYIKNEDGTCIIPRTKIEGMLCSSEKEAKETVKILNDLERWNWLREKAYDAKTDGNLIEAAKILEEAIPLNPKSIMAMEDLRQIYKKMKDVPNEIRAIKMILGVLPNNAKQLKRLEVLEKKL